MLKNAALEACSKMLHSFCTVLHFYEKGTGRRRDIPDINPFPGTLLGIALVPHPAV
jgi:hypothetical protein